MASIHLYNIPTVAATLLYSLQSNNMKTAVDACSELVESGCDSLASSTCRLALALAPFRSIHPTTMLSTDITVLLGACAGEYNLPERHAPPCAPSVSTTKTVPWTPKSVANPATLWRAVQDALKHGRVERAAFLASAVLEDADLTTLLASFGVLSAYAEWLPLVPRERVLVHAFSSLNTYKWVYPASIALRTLPEKLGRTFQVPAAALSLWNLAPPPLTQLMGEPVWVVLEACPTLQAAISLCGIAGTRGSSQIIARDDDALEEFYSAVFPNDIPDEWSVAERSKSHGQQGVVFTANPWVPAFKRLL